MSSQPYIPDELPLNNLDHRLLLPLVGQANAALARFTGVLQISRPDTVNCVRSLTQQQGTLWSVCAPRIPFRLETFRGGVAMPDPSLIPADYAPLLAEIKARVRYFVPQAVAQFEGDTVVPQDAAAALCTPYGTCVRVSQDQHVETRSILGP